MKKNLQYRPRHTLFTSVLLLASIVFSSSSYAIETFVLGNNTGAATSGSPGPSADGSRRMIYSSKPTVIFSRTSELAPANVKLNWDSSHGKASSTEALYCTRNEAGSGDNRLSLESSYVSAGHYGGVEIFKTNITGLYFSLQLKSFSSNYMAKVSPATLNITSGLTPGALNLTLDSSNHCNTKNITGEVDYATWGGLAFYSTMTFYTDQTYTSGQSSVSLLKTANYDFRFRNDNPGSGIKSYYMNVIYDISSLVVSETTCTTQPVVSGNSVSGTTVDLGTYSPNDIIKGAAPVPFAIKLAGCKGLRNINVTLSTTTMAHSPTLLGNILTANNATGVGVEISGAANNYSSQMVMIPNDTTSIYNDQRDTSSDNNIYGSGESGTTQSHTLNFLATLKRDGTQQIGSGHFKANGIFTIDYP